MNKPTKVIHPFLFSVASVVFLYSYNIDEVLVSQIIAPLGGCLMGGIFLWGAIFTILRAKIKSGILASLILIYFFSYGHFFNLVDNAQIGSFQFGIHAYMLPIWTLIFALPVIWVFMTKRNLDIFTKILNVIAVCLVAMSIGNISIFHFRSAIQTRSIEVSQLPNDNAGVDAGKLENMPDIYYIILDEHARDDILEEDFSYDSSSFISHLKDKGFFVSENSRSNYVQTSLSISSSTNFRYLDDIAETYGHDSTDLRPLRNLAVNNRLFGFLKEIGYTTVSFSTEYYFSELNNADHNLRWGLTANSFANELLNSTLLISVGKFSKNVHYAHYKKLNYIFDKLPETAKMPSPHVVFAHILAPHTPYVFDENGGFAWRSGAFRLDSSDIEISKQKREYLAQVKYVDKRITQVVDGILANSKRKPVIIIQGDHGIRWDKSVDTSFAILNALYLPGFDYSKLDNNITPVNTFRFVFNHYFGAEFEILENKNFRSGPPHYYNFKDVTESLNER